MRKIYRYQLKNLYFHSLRFNSQGMLEILREKKKREKKKEKKKTKGEIRLERNFIFKGKKRKTIATIQIYVIAN